MGNSLRIDPRTLPGLFAWYAADSLAGIGAALPADGTAVAQWNDISGNGRHLLQGTGANQPLFKINVAGLNAILPAVRFDGVNDFMTVAGTALVRPYTLVGVLKNTLADDNLPHDAGSFNAAVRIGFQVDWLTNNKLTWLDDTTVVNAGPTADTTLWHVCTLMAQPTAGPLSRFTVDGVLFTRAGADGTNTDMNIGIGRQNASNPFGGDYAEMMLFVGQFQPCMLDNIRQALAEKYGLLASQTLAGQ